MTKKTTKRTSESKLRNMRQGQQKIKLDIKKPTPTSPPLPLPFPPVQKVEQIVAKLVAKPRLARFPNAFIMYRNEYVQYLKSQGYHISMTELSPMISASWKKESEFVKDAYTKLSSEAEKLYVRDTGSTQPQITIRYPPESNSRSMRTKDDATIMIPKDDHHHQTTYQPNYAENDLFNFNLLLSNANGYSKNFDAKEPPLDGGIDFIRLPFDSPKVDNPFPIAPTPPITPITMDFFSSYNLQGNLPPNNHQLPPVSHAFNPASFNGPTLDSFDEFLNQAPLGSPCSTSSSPSDTTSFEELLFSPDIDDNGRFFEKSDFQSTFPTDINVEVESPLQSPNLYLYPGQSYIPTSNLQ